MSDADRIKEIQQRMKQVRRELGDDIATSARDLTNWRSFIRAKPWLCVAAAVAVGYVLAPKGPPVVQFRNSDLQSLLRDNVAAIPTERPQPGLGRRVVRTLLSNVGGLVVRGAMAYVGHRIANSPTQSNSEHEESAPF
jgi:hypothetical protein